MPIISGSSGGGAGSLTAICDSIAGVGGVASFDTNTIIGGNIPQSYRHLYFVVTGRSSAGATNDNIVILLNNDSGSRYTNQLQRIISATVSNADNGVAITQLNGPDWTGNGDTAGSASNMACTVFDYTNTTFHKNLSWTTGMRRQSSTDATGLWNGWYQQAVAITRIAISLAGGNHMQGSRFTLYGFN